MATLCNQFLKRHEVGQILLKGERPAHVLPFAVVKERSKYLLMHRCFLFNSYHQLTIMGSTIQIIKRNARIWLSSMIDWKLVDLSPATPCVLSDLKMEI